MKWVWTGPFGDLSESWSSNDKSLPNLSAVFWPENDFKKGAPPKKSPDGSSVWKKMENDSQSINFSAMTGLKDRGICYAWTVIESDSPINLNGELSIDYWGKVWLNGSLVLEIREHSGSPVKGLPVSLRLMPGKNNLLVKVHPGSGGCMLGLRIPECPPTVRFVNPLETDGK
jgi:hypothetical protein